MTRKATIVTDKTVTDAIVETTVIPGCLRANRQARPAGLIRRARTGSLLRYRDRSSARAEALS